MFSIWVSTPRRAAATARLLIDEGFANGGSYADCLGEGAPAVKNRYPRFDTGRGEVVYEHVLGHEHHDHMVCVLCKRIEEFQDEEIEKLQRKNAERLGFVMTGHMLRLSGICGSCADELREDGRLDEEIERLG